MSHVWDAMKKHKAEEASPEASAESPSRSGQERASAGGTSEQAKPKAGGQPLDNGYTELLTAHHDRGGPITEQFRALRTHLLAHYADKRFSAIVTSAEAGEGKTVTCLNLGIVLAERPERTTIVVDGDLRKGNISSYLNIEKSPGMADLVRGGTAIEAVVRPTVYPNLFVIPAGEARQREVGELMGRPELKEIAAELRRKYDYVLVDTPPINRAADAGMLGQAVDGALLVVRMNKTHRESVDRAIRLLHAASVSVAGLILTHQKFYIPNYLYRYS
ncbi:MAG TPA: CpsD/CapB family tyrosine-protein kinase [Planctomycetota bacterium]|nr:CpsD/CapB family tyrosine-protein kinase [Planctomycetota bacterium]